MHSVETYGHTNILAWRICKKNATDSVFKKKIKNLWANWQVSGYYTQLKL